MSRKFDIVLHFHGGDETLLDIDPKIWKYQNLLDEVFRSRWMPDAGEEGMVFAKILSDLEEPPAQLQILSDEQMTVMFERNRTNYEVHIHITFEVVHPFAREETEEPSRVYQDLEEDDVREEELSEEELDEDDLLTRGDDIMSDVGSLDGCGNFVTTTDEEEWNDEDGDFPTGGRDPMWSYMDKDYYEEPEDHYERPQFIALQTIWENVAACRRAVKDFAIREGFILEKVKSDKDRYTMKCRAEDCPWRFHASKVSDGTTFMLKTYTDEHTCIRTELGHTSAEWIANKIKDTLKSNPLATTTMLREVIQGFGVSVSYMQIWRARQKAMMLLDGDHDTAFHALPFYCHQLEKYMPNSRIILQYEMARNDASKATSSGAIPCVPQFKRIFIGMAPLREGFLAGCDPFFGLDGCHLKGAFGGILLSVVSLDGDNGIYPICWAIVEAETRDNWLFFLRNMEQFLGGFSTDKPWTIMTDRQKGLIQAIEEVIPHAINRKCAKHIFSNLAKRYASKKLRKAFWGASRAYTEVKFWVNMEKIKDINPKAYEWLMRIEPELWSRCAYDTRLKNFHVTNNIAESFNSWIGKYRHKPIMALLEGLRKSVMVRIQDRKIKADEWARPIMSAIWKKINRNMMLAAKMDLQHASSTTMEVSDFYSHNIVDLAAKTCDCRYWEVTGWPCTHACKAIQFCRLQDNLSDYVAPQWLKSQFLKTYAHTITPIPHEKNWNYNEMTIVVPKDLAPPPFRRLPGRPRVSRRRELQEDDPKRSSKGGVCSRCGEMGHNKRTCQSGAVGSGRSRRRRRTYETSGTATQEEQVDSNEPLASYMHRTQGRRRN